MNTAAFLLCVCSLAAAAQESQWAHLGPNGKLVYKTTARGDRMADFSYAGYRGGGVPLPHAEAAETLAASGGDDTAAVQAALDRVGEAAARQGRTLALVLGPGTFHLSETVRVVAAHVVLRGSGAAKTMLVLTGRPHLGIRVAPGSDTQTDTGEDVSPATAAAAESMGSTTLAPTYVPSGAREIAVASAAGFVAGDTVLLTRSIPEAYNAFMGMDRLRRSGREEHWVGPRIVVEREVEAVHGSTLVLTVPLTDDYDPRFGGGAGTRVDKIARPARLAEVGLEDFAITCPPLKIDLSDPHFDGVVLDGVEDGWMRGLRFEDTTNTVTIGVRARRITVDKVSVLQRIPIQSSAKNFAFSLAGTQTLLMHVSVRGDKVFFVATQAREQGPNVVLASSFHGDQALEPHQRWGTGLLVDNVTVDGGAIHFINRGIMGSGHGWTMGWGVVWNSSATSLTVQQPPGAMNWLVGSTGTREGKPMPVEGAKGPDLPEGIVESAGKRVKPASLYLQQLQDRLGPKAVAALLP